MYEVSKKELFKIVNEKVGKFKLMLFKKELENFSKSVAPDMKEEHLIYKYYIIKPTISKSGTMITLVPYKIMISVYWIANSTERLLEKQYWYIPMPRSEINELTNTNNNYTCENKSKIVTRKKLVYKIKINKEEVG